MKKLKGATSINRLLVMCEGFTDVLVMEELVGQAGEVPEVIFGDVGGWPGLRNKDPEFLLLGSKAVIVVMDGDEGRKLSKRSRPLTEMAREQQRRLAAHGIELRVLGRYGIENYFPRAAVEQVVQRDLSSYYPVPEDVPFVEHVSEDRKGLSYRFKRWVAAVLDLKMRGPRQPLYSKSRNREVARFISLENDLAGTDLREIVNEIAHRAIALRQE